MLIFGSATTLAFYTPVFISDLINLISMGYDMLFGIDIDYSISTLTKFLSPLLMMGMGKTIQEWDQIQFSNMFLPIVLMFGAIEDLANMSRFLFACMKNL